MESKDMHETNHVMNKAAAMRGPAYAAVLRCAGQGSGLNIQIPPK